MQYIAVIHKDPDSAYGVSFPDVKGCFSAADELNNVLANAIEALSLYFDNIPTVPASDLEAIQKAAKDDLAHGAFLLSVPLVTMAHKQVRANISMDKGMLDAIDIAAAERKLTRSAFIAEASKNEIERRDAYP